NITGTRSRTSSRFWTASPSAFSKRRKSIEGLAAGTAKEDSSVEEPGKEDLEQRAEGAVVLRRYRHCVRARRRGRRVRRQQVAAISRAQPQRPGADDRRRRLHPLGVERHR